MTEQGNHLEKYIRLNIEFPTKAGSLSKILAIQKRLLEKLVRTKQSDEQKEFITAVAEGYDLTLELVKYFKEVIQDVANDAYVLSDIAEFREKFAFQSEVLSEYIQRDLKDLEALKAKRNESTSKD